MSIYHSATTAEVARYLEQSKEMFKRSKPNENQDDKLSNSLLIIGYNQFQKKDFTEALRYYERVYELSKKSPNAHAVACISMALCSEELGNRKEAIKYYLEVTAMKNLKKDEPIFILNIQSDKLRSLSET